MIFPINKFPYDVYEQFRTPNQSCVLSFSHLNDDDIAQRLEDFTVWEWDQITSEFWVVPFAQYDNFVKRYFSALKKATGAYPFDMFDDETFIVCQWHDPKKQWAVMGAFNCCSVALEKTVDLNDDWYLYSSLSDHNYYQQIMDDLKYNAENPKFPTSDVVGLWANMRLDKSVSKENFLLRFLQPQDQWDPISSLARTAIEEHLCMLQSKILQAAVDNSSASNVKRKM